MQFRHLAFLLSLSASIAAASAQAADFRCGISDNYVLTENLRVSDSATAPAIIRRSDTSDMFVEFVFGKEETSGTLAGQRVLAARVARVKGIPAGVELFGTLPPDAKVQYGAVTYVAANANHMTLTVFTKGSQLAIACERL